MSEATHTVSTGVVALIPSAKGFGAAVSKEIGGDLAKAGEKGGRGYAGRFGDSLKKWGKRATIGAAAGIGAVFGTSLVKGFGRLKAIEQAESKLTGLGHSARTVEGIMDNATASVRGTAFGLGEAATAAAGAVASGVKPGRDLQRTLTLVGDSATIAGTGFDEMGAIFNKVAASDMIQGDVLAQLGDRGIPILQLLSDELGVSATEVRKLASEGKINFETFQDAMERGLGGAAQESGKTFSGAMANVGAALGRIGANLLGGVFPKIAPALQVLIERMGPLEDVAKRVGAGFGDFLSRGVDLAATAWGHLSSAWSSGSGLLGGLRGLVRLFQGKGTGSLAQWLEVPQGHAAIQALNRIRTFVTKDIPDGLAKVRDIAVGVFKVFTMQGTGALAKALGVDQSHWIVQGLLSIRTGAVDLFRELIDGIQAFASAWAYNDGEITSSGIPGVMERIGYWARQTFDYVQSTVIPTAVTLAKWLWDNRQALLTLGAAVLGGVAAFKAFMFIRTVITAVKAARAAVLVFNAALLANPIGIVITAMGALVAALVYLYNTNDTARRVMDAAWAAIKGAVSAVVTWFTGTAWPGMRDTYRSLRDTAVTVKDRVVGAWDSMRDGISRGWDKIKAVIDRFKEALSSLRTRFRSVRDGIRDAWSVLGGIIARPINSVIDSVNSFLENLRGGLNKIPGVEFSGSWGGIPNVPVPSAPRMSHGAGGAATGGVFAAAGGMIPGFSPHDRADNIPAWLTAGEYVLPVRATAKIARTMGSGFLEWLRRGMPDTHLSGPGRSKSAADPHGVPRYADGGWIGNVMDWVGNVWDGGAGVIQAVYDKLLGGLGDSWPAQVARGVIGGTASKVASWVRSLVFGGEGEPGDVPRLGWPVSGRVTSHYGPRYLPGLGRDFHAGTDFAARTGTPVRAVGAGMAYVGSSRGGGLHVGIQHPGGLHSGYLHLSRPLVMPGVMVKRGQVIAASGNTGAYTTGPHLHFQLGRGASFWTNHFNPLPWLQRGGGMADGGLVKPFIADSGVTLAPGLNVLDNRLGKPEPLGRLDQQRSPLIGEVHFHDSDDPRSRRDGFDELTMTLHDLRRGSLADRRVGATP